MTLSKSVQPSNMDKFVCALYFVLFWGNVQGIVNYCETNTYMTNSSWLQLNKEASNFEFAIENHFKGLHCCAKGYRSIEWHKDGQPYPWAGGVSNLILYPESANQTVYTQAVSASDSGNYTCLLRNATHVHSHTVRLQVFDKVPDDPKVTYIPSDQQIKCGGSIRLFCEAFLGRVDLPDAHNEVKWFRKSDNESIEDTSRIQQQQVSREEGEIFGAYLIINDVRKEDFGKYVCRISKPDRHVDIEVYLDERVVVEAAPPNPVPWKKFLVALVVVFVGLVTILVLYMQYGLLVRVCFKDRFASSEDHDGKVNDVLICYSPKDEEITSGVLIPTLESRYGYKCGCRELTTNVNRWSIELNVAACKSRRILAVLSPACFGENWNTHVLFHALKQLRALGPPVTVLLLKQLPVAEPQIKNSEGETLDSMLRSVKLIQWERISDKFWLSLRLQLPPKRFDGVISSENITLHMSNFRRLSGNSQEFSA